MRSRTSTVLGSLGLLAALGCGTPESSDAEWAADSSVAPYDDGEDVLEKSQVVGGLTAQYFHNVNFTDLAFQRVDANINFTWGTKSPLPGKLYADAFSVRWTGFVKAGHTHTYTFYARSDEGVRVWVNGQNIINHWTNQTLSEKSGTIALRAGKSYPIKVEYYDKTGDATMELRWSDPGLPKQIVSSSRLFVTYPCSRVCADPTPICGPDGQCTDERWVEPITTLPERFRSTIDTTLWTKWVRSVIPVVGQAATKNAALLEVAYFVEKIHMPQGNVLATDLISSMLGADHPTRISVWPACPGAYQRPGAPDQSNAGAAADNTHVGEDWVLRYPKCIGENALACSKMRPGTLCLNGGLSDPLDLDPKQETLSHEYGHTLDMHRKSYVDTSVSDLDNHLFPSNPTEGPAWSASKYFMNPSPITRYGRDRGARIMSDQEISYWSITHKFAMSKYPAGWGYRLKTARCPNRGLTTPCPDTLTRTYAVPLDSWR